jgi:hypothetical protein
LMRCGVEVLEVVDAGSMVDAAAAGAGFLFIYLCDATLSSSFEGGKRMYGNWTVR